MHRLGYRKVGRGQEGGGNIHVADGFLNYGPFGYVGPSKQERDPDRAVVQQVSVCLFSSIPQPFTMIGGNQNNRFGMILIPPCHEAPDLRIGVRDFAIIWRILVLGGKWFWGTVWPMGVEQMNPYKRGPFVVDECCQRIVDHHTGLAFISPVQLVR